MHHDRTDDPHREPTAAEYVECGRAWQASERAGADDYWPVGRGERTSDDAQCEHCGSTSGNTSPGLGGSGRRHVDPTDCILSLRAENERLRGEVQNLRNAVHQDTVAQDMLFAEVDRLRVALTRAIDILEARGLRDEVAHVVALAEAAA